MNILLINPWITDFAAYDFWIKPLGLLYVGAFLKKRGHNVRLIDCMDRFQDGSGVNVSHDTQHFNTGKFHREIIKKPEFFSHVPRHYCRYGIPVDIFRKLVLTGEKPDVILVSSMMTYWYVGIQEVVRQLHELLPGIPVILGGVYATLCEQHAKKHSGADVVIKNCPPVELIDIVESTGGKKCDGPLVSDSLNEWPEPLWELYRTLKTAMALTSRGCPFNCTVCASRNLFDGFEQRDPDSAAESILRLAQMGVEDIAFSDDALLIDAEHHAIPMFKRLADGTIPVRLHTPNGLHIRGITNNLATLMKQAGMVTVRLSLETVSENRSDDFSKKVSRDEFREAVCALCGAGFTSENLGTYILVGLPGQTMEEVLDTVEFVYSAGVMIRPALFSPVPYTVEFERAVERGVIRRDDDPLLQNNTLRTVDWFVGGNEGYNKFKDMITKRNEEIRKEKRMI